MKLLIMAQTPEALVLVVGGVRVVRGGRRRVSQSQLELRQAERRAAALSPSSEARPGQARLFDRTRI
jgi:hypothetical protein